MLKQQLKSKNKEKTFSFKLLLSRLQPAQNCVAVGG